MLFRSLHQHVVIFAQLRIAGQQVRLVVLIEDFFHKEIEGAAVGSKRKDAEYLKESLQKIEYEIKKLAQLSSKNNVYANSSEVKLYANRK